MVAVEKKTSKRKVNHSSLFVSRPKNFGIGKDVPYKRDLSRFMRWPTFVTMQRKKRVLQRRLKVPPAINQFQCVLDRDTRVELFRMIQSYAPETRKENRQRLKGIANLKITNPTETVNPEAPISVVTGIQEVTRLIERKKAKLVVIANNVDPIELVLWMPALCRANRIPYAIVTDIARLGQVTHQKTATCLAFTDVRAEDQVAFSRLIKAINARFVSRSDLFRRRWGGLEMSLRSQAAARKRSLRLRNNFGR